MKAGSVLVNVSRGDIVDEGALTDALQRDHLRGAALDVYDGEFERVPIPRLWSDSKVLITPHISAASDQDRHGAIDLFCANLRLSRWRAAPKRCRLGTELLAPSEEQRLALLALAAGGSAERELK
jgi:phosphoglycerate dehydrogenase-like enzyme